MTKFMHIRQPDRDGLSPRGGITIAYRLEPKSRAAMCGVSFCSPKDNYSKRVGRSISSKRLESQPLRITMDEVITCFTIAQIVRTFLVEWGMRKLLGKMPGTSWQWSVDGFESAGPPNSHRFEHAWKANLIGPGGSVALLEIDGKSDATCGWVNIIPRWARKVGWTWI